MGIFRQFPYSNFHEMNMDEIIKIIKNMLEEWSQYHAEWDSWMDQMNDDWSNYQEVMNTAWANMQDFINNYFDNLDVQEEVNNKIVAMIQTGEFGQLVNEYIPPAVTSWLALNITQPTGVVIDKSLTIEGACADAKATGDAIQNLNDGYTNYLEGYGLSQTGEIVETENVSVSDYIPVNGSTNYLAIVTYQNPSERTNLRVIEYNANKTFVDYWGANPVKSFTTNSATRFIRISFDSDFEGTVLKINDLTTIYKATSTKSLDDRFAYYKTIHNPETDYIDKNKVIRGVRIDSTTGGYERVADNDSSVTDFIPVAAGNVFYTGSAIDSQHYAYYDANKSFLSSIIDYSENLGSPFTVPAGAYYIRLTINSVFIANAWLSTYNYQPNPYSTIDVPTTVFTNSVNEIVDSTEWDNVIPLSKHDPLTNYIDMTKVTNGYISNTGSYVPYESLRCTDFVPLEEGETYYRGIGIYSGDYYAFYDANKAVVASGSTLGNLGTSFTVPEGAIYGRFTILDGASDQEVWIFTQNGRPLDYALMYYFGAKMNNAVKHAYDGEPNPTVYDGMDIQAFDKGICIGDSLTEGIFNYDDNGDTGYISIPNMSYPAAMERITGINMTNRGASGLTSLEWYNANVNTDTSNHKFAIIQFGVNDVIRYGQGWTQYSIDGYTGIINKLKSENTNIKIFVSTVLPAESYAPSNYASFNTGLKEFVESLNDANVILLDLATYGNTEPTQYNAGHLSAYGYWRLAKDYINYISWYMHTNGMLFREIQFIGTNKHY